VYVSPLLTSELLNQSEEHTASIFRVLSQAKIQQKQVVRKRIYFPPKRRALAKLHGVTTQKTALFIVTAVGISNPK
jgi:hypothetical protein